MINTFLVSTGGRLHGFHAQPKRTWPGKGCQAEGGALREARQGGGGWWGRRAMHCDPWAWQGPYQHWRGRLGDLSERLFFYTVVIPFVMIPEFWLSEQPLETRIFSWTFWWAENTQMKKNKWFLVCFFAQPLWLCEKKTTPYTVSMQYCPMLSSAGGSCDLTAHRGGGGGGGSWWWASIAKGGGCTLTMVLIQPHGPCSVSWRDTCWLLTHTFWFQCFFFLIFFFYISFGNNGILTLSPKTKTNPKACTVVVKCRYVKQVKSWLTDQYSVGMWLSWLVLLLERSCCLPKTVALQI